MNWFSRESAITTYHVGQPTVVLMPGDITAQEVDAVVNAANETLLGGGGVDGAIHRAAGPELLAECRTLGRCPTGEARLTRGYRLKARYVIHAVGPVYRGRPEDAELLAGAYRASMALASQHNLKTLAFPAISTGIYRYPKEQAGLIALRTVRDYLAEHPEIEQVRFVLWDRDGTRAAYDRAAAQIFHP